MVPLVHHFLPRTQALKNSQAHRKRTLKIGGEVLVDLILWVQLLLKAKNGISLNLIVTR